MVGSISAGGVAAIILAAFWALLVVFIALVLVNLFRVLESTKMLIDGITQETVPLLGEVKTTVAGVNKELDRVDGISDVPGAAEHDERRRSRDHDRHDDHVRRLGPRREPAVLLRGPGLESDRGAFRLLGALERGDRDDRAGAADGAHGDGDVEHADPRELDRVDGISDVPGAAEHDERG